MDAEPISKLAHGRSCDVLGEDFGSIGGIQTGLSLDMVFRHRAPLIDSPGIVRASPSTPGTPENTGNQRFERPSEGSRSK